MLYYHIFHTKSSVIAFSKRSILLLCILMSANCTNMAQQKKMKELTTEEKRVLIEKGTERPFTGKYTDFAEKGVYACKQCGAHLYHSEDKFPSHCGWPSFDDEIKGAVKRISDKDGMRTEIVCAKCNGHLGHVFLGEGFTEKDTRHCVNSISLDFIPANPHFEVAIFAGGCFWGVEYFMEKQKGVSSVESGYIGGKSLDPTYKEVCSPKNTHVEAVQIVYDPKVTNYETLARLFFEIHDPTQVDRQGPDIGLQYRSEIFYTKDTHRIIAEKLIALLETKGHKVATRITPASKFYVAEDYHQNYYERKGSKPYCHGYTKRF